MILTAVKFVSVAGAIIRNPIAEFECIYAGCLCLVCGRAFIHVRGAGEGTIHLILTVSAVFLLITFPMCRYADTLHPNSEYG